MKKIGTEIKKGFTSNFVVIIRNQVESPKRRMWGSTLAALFLSLALVGGSAAVSAAMAGPLSFAQADTGSLNIWWPSASAEVAGTQPFKAVVPGIAVEQYEMFWYVDNGQWNWMDNNYTDSPHKEARVDVSGWTWRGAGPYKVTFVARQNGNIIAQKSVDLKTGNPSSNASSNSAQPAPQQDTAKEAPKTEGKTEATTEVKTEAVQISQPQTLQQQTPVSQPVQVSAPIVSFSGGSLQGAKLYNNPNNPAAGQANSWRSSRPVDAAKMDSIAAQPQAKWLGGWNGNVEQDVRDTVAAASGQGAMPVFIAYNIPGRDCGGYSAGGVSRDSYGSWIGSIAKGIGSGKAVVLLEPDALAALSCLSQGDQETRVQLIKEAIDTLKKNPNTLVYLDAGHSGWMGAEQMAGILNRAGVAQTDGFFLNVSNFRTTSGEVAFGTQVSGLTGGKHFVVDTSRNGNGPLGNEWCNPAGRAIGEKPTTNTGNALVDAYFWAKTPGESDGSCNGAPAAGQWWPEYALSLVNNAK